MNFGWSDEERQFRANVDAFIGANWHADPGAADAEGLGTADRVRSFNRAAGRQGWLTMAWPTAYGGRNASHTEQLIFNEEAARNGLPLGATGNLIGPTLIVHGSDEQRREHLPLIASAERVWCQGFSEPGSGSDLASLQTRAELDGDTYVVNGQKIWTSGAHRADWIFALVRTDPSAPKHRGITFLMIDMRTPGVSTSPIQQMHGDAEFNETFFEDVRVPTANVVGEVNRGWYVATTTLDFERSGVHLVSATARQFRRFLDLLAAHDRRPSGPTRAAAADTATEIEIARLLAYRVASMQARGLVPNYEASMSKVFGSELTQRSARRAVGALGLYGQLTPESAHVRSSGVFAQRYIWTVSRTIAGGTSEVQRNIIAGRGLGLPRA